MVIPLESVGVVKLVGQCQRLGEELGSVGVGERNEGSDCVVKS